MLDLTNQQFGRLTVKAYAGYREIGARRKRFHQWSCDCSCGATGVIVTTTQLRTTYRPTRSCGCLMLEKATENCIKRSRTHGETRMVNGKRTETPEYRCWKSIHTRCYNSKFKQFKDYGGRGIKVCDRWRESFLNFLEDMGRKPSPDHSIERKNTDGDYEPGNCYWATDKEQRRNRRTTRWVTINGATRSLAAWLEMVGTPKSTFEWRERQGWTEAEAILGKGRA